MSFIGDIKEILELPSYLSKISFDQLHAAFAYLLVPGMVVLFLAAGLTFDGPDHGVSLLEIQSRLGSEGVIVDYQGVLLLLESDVSGVAFTLKNSSDKSSWLSLPRDVLARNRSQVRVDQNGLEIRQPLMGAAPPMAVLMSGELEGDVLLPGKRVKPEHLRLRPTVAISLAVWCLLPVMVGMGLVVDRYAVEFHRSAERERKTEPSSQM